MVYLDESIVLIFVLSFLIFLARREKRERTITIVVKR